MYIYTHIYRYKSRERETDLVDDGDVFSAEGSTVMGLMASDIRGREGVDGDDIVSEGVRD